MSELLLENKKARFHYELQDTLRCGMELLGSEVKSAKLKKVNFNDSFVSLSKANELFLENFHISPYTFGTHSNHPPLRKRRLLAHKREILKLRRQVIEKGYTLVPLRLILDKGLLKMEIALARGKKLHDKRQSLKDKALDQEAKKELKGRNLI